MKKEWKLQQYIFNFLLPFFIYLIFYSKDRVHSTPTNADFWIIIAMGMAIGAGLSNFIGWLGKKKKNKI